LKLLLDEMYSPRAAEALRAAGIDASTVVELGLAGGADPEVLEAAIAQGRTLLTENVADFTRISAEHLLAGRHHPGVLIALSSRFSRRAAGSGPLVAAILEIAEEQLTDCLIYLRAPTSARASRR
jgi:predicted nuclease of predicted toxin-antitoxin system